MELKCGVMHIGQVRNEEVQRRTGVIRELAGRTKKYVEVVWIYGENGGGPVSEENNGI